MPRFICKVTAFWILVCLSTFTVIKWREGKIHWIIPTIVIIANVCPILKKGWDKFMDSGDSSSYED